MVYEHQEDFLILHPLNAFGKLLYAVFGKTKRSDLIIMAPPGEPPYRPEWTKSLFTIVFGAYMWISVVVLLKLLIAMMSDTYQRIQTQSDIEWKFGLSKLIRSIHRTTTTYPPINLFTTLATCFFSIYNKKARNKRPSLARMMSYLQDDPAAGIRHDSRIPRKSIVLPTFQMSKSLESRTSYDEQMRWLENAVNWKVVVEKYRFLRESVRPTKEVDINEKEDPEEENDSQDETLTSRSSKTPNTIKRRRADV